AKDVFSRLGVLSERELTARADIQWDRYIKVGEIEASCAIDIARSMVLPAVVTYLGRLMTASSASRGINAVCERVAGLADSLVDAIATLEHAQHAAHEASSVQAEARAVVTEVIPAQAALRVIVDELETLVDDELWPLPKYRELLFQY
ncbi:MAG: glutamine synthetase type III, partial [Chloroflexota bacterium]|nr:glutamine synthetase type III [Chloroflexota bacterium]